jgi:hypothetical protein
MAFFFNKYRCMEELHYTMQEFTVLNNELLKSAPYIWLFCLRIK